MEKRWCFSSSSKSEMLVPSSTLPLRSTALAWKSRASAMEVLPDALCPARAMFRMSSVRYFDMGETPDQWLVSGSLQDQVPRRNRFRRKRQRVHGGLAASL